MQMLHANPYDLPRTSRLALALISSLLTGLIATALLQWNTVRANMEAPEQMPTNVSDTDQDGLSDLEELAYRTSIYTADSDGDKVNDGDEVQKGSNPQGPGMLPSSPLTAPAGPDQDHDSITDDNEAAWGTDARNADTDADGFPDGLEIENGFDPSATGRPRVDVMIPSLKVNAPLVWTEDTDEKTIERDLTRGVIHFPGTAVPGEDGNAFITGHSSDYIWQRGPYRDIFKNLPKLKEGDVVSFRFSYANGKVRDVKYRLTEKLVTAPTDRSLLSPTPTPTLTLVTCYPVGSNTQRLAWRGTLVH